MSIRILAAAIALVAQVLAARLVGAEAFGHYALVLVWLVLLGHAATLGTNQLICRFLAAYRAEGDAGAALGLLRFALLLAGGGAAFIAVLGAGLISADVLGLPPDLAALAMLGLLIVPLLMLQDFLEAIARGLDRPLLGIGPAVLLRHLAIILGVAIVAVSGGNADAVTIMAWTIGGLGASVAIQYLLLHKVLRAEIGDARPVYRWRFWLKTAAPIALLDASETLFNNADILILGFFVPPEIVAYYFAATRLAQILGYVPYGITAATAQKYAALAAKGERDRLQGLINSVAALSTALTGLGALLLWAVAPIALSLFGEGYQSAIAIVPILALGLVMASAMGPGEDVLTMLGQERACAMAFVAALAVTVGLNLALIPVFGMVGAAMATAAGLSARGMILAYLAQQRLGLTLPIGLNGGRRWIAGGAAP